MSELVAETPPAPEGTTTTEVPPSTEPPTTTPKGRRSSSAAALQGAEADEVKSLSEQFGIVDIKAGNIGSGAGGGFGLNAPGTGPKVKSWAGAGAPKGFIVNEECKAAWEKMCNDNDPIHFVVGKYSADYKSLELASSGEGRLSAFVAALTSELGDDKIGWGGFRCYGVDDRGNTVSKRAKIVFIQYMPPNAPAMKKAKMGSHKGAAKAAFDKAHMDQLVENVVEDLVPADLVTALQAATGAHKPNGYEFEVGEFVSADYYNRGIGKDAKA
ncbi:hypothetical protein TrVE_jg1393 [Triparma verrucosa]|uniref:ADF-H domain-containing protein n=2 Tax=Triparma TaxID=722752 RepID=A0A9W7BRB5_9STRA|nr:hypothetical protein TrST_g11832 [Triparma strigata]GMI15985.1 hypothetical protein TrVE_jg1393 [Triparma verrucosa]